MLVHNEKEPWKDPHPDIDAGDAAADGRAIRLMVATGAVLAEHYLAEGGNVNRATAAEMGPPSAKRFKRRQRLFKAVLVKILRRVLDEAQRAGRLGPRIDRSFSIEMEEIKDDEETPAEVVGRALALAVEKELATPDGARGVWRRFSEKVDDGWEGEIAGV